VFERSLDTVTRGRGDAEEERYGSMEVRGYGMRSDEERIDLEKEQNQ